MYSSHLWLWGRLFGRIGKIYPSKGYEKHNFRLESCRLVFYCPSYHEDVQFFLYQIIFQCDSILFIQLQRFTLPSETAGTKVGLMWYSNRNFRRCLTTETDSKRVQNGLMQEAYVGARVNTQSTGFFNVFWGHCEWLQVVDVMSMLMYVHILYPIFFLYGK